jgi:hypothetical protein
VKGAKDVVRMVFDDIVVNAGALGAAFRARLYIDVWHLLLSIRLEKAGMVLRFLGA